jgi:hypothetical protein
MNLVNLPHCQPPVPLPGKPKIGEKHEKELEVHALGVVFRDDCGYSGRTNATTGASRKRD